MVQRLARLPICHTQGVDAVLVLTVQAAKRGSHDSGHTSVLFFTIRSAMRAAKGIELAHQLAKRGLHHAAIPRAVTDFASDDVVVDGPKLFTQHFSLSAPTVQGAARRRRVCPLGACTLD